MARKKLIIHWTSCPNPRCWFQWKIWPFLTKNSKNWPDFEIWNKGWPIIRVTKQNMTFPCILSFEVYSARIYILQDFSLVFSNPNTSRFWKQNFSNSWRKKVDFDASITTASILKEFFIFYNKVKHISIRIKEIFPEKQASSLPATMAKSKMLSQHFF